jgi:hypothetical protein
MGLRAMKLTMPRHTCAGRQRSREKSDLKMPKAAWVTRGGLRKTSKRCANHRLGGTPPIFLNVGRTTHTKTGVFLDHGLFGLLVRVCDMTT